MRHSIGWNCGYTNRLAIASVPLVLWFAETEFGKSAWKTCDLFDYWRGRHGLTLARSGSETSAVEGGRA